MQWGYSLNPGPRYYIGGYFWWYGEEDVFGQDGGCGRLKADFATAFSAGTPRSVRARSASPSGAMLPAVPDRGQHRRSR